MLPPASDLSVEAAPHAASGGASQQRSRENREVAILLVSIFVIASCGLFYELLISSISSYFLGSSITHFSITIGLFMFFMGVGSFLSRFVTTRLLDWFVGIEILVGLVGGFSTLILYAAFSLTPYYYLVAGALIAVVSALIGMEIPLVTRLAHQYRPLKDALATMLAFDYMGALVASVLFPLVLLPYLGLMQTAFLVGLLNAGVAFVTLVEFRSKLTWYPVFLRCNIGVTLVLFIGLCFSMQVGSFFERFLYEDEIVYSKQTPYQRLIMTKHHEDIRLFINGDLQFSSLDEYRYHEPLVHIPLGLLQVRERILILGGGDGLVAREVLKYKDVQEIVLVDLDAEMLRISREHALLRSINEDATLSPKVQLIAQDAYKYIESGADRFSAIIVDLPDPNDLSLGKLYSFEFYSLLKKRLAEDGILITQSASPFLAREVFWSIHHTLKQVFPVVVPLNSYVPSFGPWGFNMAANRQLDVGSCRLLVPTKFLRSETLPTHFVFDPDMSEVPAEINRLENQAVVQYYEQSWKKWE